MFNDLSGLIKLILIAIFGVAWIGKLIYENFVKPLQQGGAPQPPRMGPRDEEAIRRFLDQIRGATQEAELDEERLPERNAPPPRLGVPEAEATPPQQLEAVETASPQAATRRLVELEVPASPPAEPPPEHGPDSVHQYIERLAHKTLEGERNPQRKATSQRLRGINASLKDAILAEIVLSPPKAFAKRRRSPRIRLK